MVHRRSPKSLARRYIRKHAFEDKILSETVSRTSYVEVRDHVCAVVTDVQMSQIPQVEKGLVLVNSRLTGVWQRDQ